MYVRTYVPTYEYDVRTYLPMHMMTYAPSHLPTYLPPYLPLGLLRCLLLPGHPPSSPEVLLHHKLVPWPLHHEGIDGWIQEDVLYPSV